MADRWEVSPEYPAGHSVPLTKAELADMEARRIAGEANALKEAADAKEEALLVQRLEDAIVTLEAEQTRKPTDPHMPVTIALARLQLRRLS